MRHGYVLKRHHRTLAGHKGNTEAYMQVLMRPCSCRYRILEQCGIISLLCLQSFYSATSITSSAQQYACVCKYLRTKLHWHSHPNCLETRKEIGRIITCKTISFNFSRVTVSYPSSRETWINRLIPTAITRNDSPLSQTWCQESIVWLFRCKIVLFGGRQPMHTFADTVRSCEWDDLSDNHYPKLPSVRTYLLPYAKGVSLALANVRSAFWIEFLSSFRSINKPHLIF